jgi:hypothetical protein
MFCSEESGQQFSVKSGVASFWWRKFFGEEGKRLPRAIDFLLKNSSNVGIGGVSGKGNWSRGIGKMERNGGRKGRFCYMKGKSHFRCPGKTTYGGCCISERL